MPTVSNPIAPTATPTIWLRVGRSPSRAAAITIVRMTCTCNTNAAIPGGIPACNEVYRKPNWPSDMNTPTVATVRHGATGRGMKNTAGKTTNVKRIAAKSNGGTPCNPQLMTTKLKPQMVATIAAKSESRVVMTDSMPESSM
jgi:hypothetical protein